MSLTAECLVAVSGLFPDGPLGPADAREAAKVPKAWREAAETFLDDEAMTKFRLAPQLDWRKTWDRLSRGLDPETAATVTSAMADDELSRDYQLCWSNALEYVRSRWPVLQMDAIPTPILLPPGSVETGRCETLYAAVNDPASVIRDLHTGALTADQADALRTVFPALTEMLRSLILEGVTERQAKSKDYRLPYGKEATLRKILGMPPGQPLSRLEPPAAKASKPPPVKVDFVRREQTKAQALEDSREKTA